MDDAGEALGSWGDGSSDFRGNYYVVVVDGYAPFESDVYIHNNRRFKHRGFEQSGRKLVHNYPNNN